MANIVLKLGGLDLSSYVRVNPDERLDLGQGDMVEAAWSDSPFFEGQSLTSLHIKNKELKVPLYLHPAAAPYTNDALNQLVQQVNQRLRLVTDLGQTLYVEWRNAQASNSTFFTLQFGRFDPDFNFRVTEKGWLAGVLHLWVLPYGHTATERSLGTYAAPSMQSGMVVQPPSMIAAGGSIAGDVPPQFDLRMAVGSYLGDDGRLGIIAALPQASYNPIVPIASIMVLNDVGVATPIVGASGAWGSQCIAIDQVATIAGFTNFSGQRLQVAFSPASVYSGDNRILGLVRARALPFGLQAVDSLSGRALGPTVVATSVDGWQIVDYGILRVAPWAATVGVTINVYDNIDLLASGIFAPRRVPPNWTKEHGPIFILPNNSTVFQLDWNSQALAMDGFDGVSGAALTQDQLGNSWSTPSYVGYYDGRSGVTATGIGSTVSALVGTYVHPGFQDLVVEGAFFGYLASLSDLRVGVAVTGATTLDVYAQLGITPNGTAFMSVHGYNGFGIASQGIPSPLPATVSSFYLKCMVRGNIVTANFAGPSGFLSASASGVVASIGGGALNTSTYSQSAFSMVGASMALEGFRARLLATQSYQSRDQLRVLQPLLQHTRESPDPTWGGGVGTPVERIDLQARQRGAIQSLVLGAPSLGAGFFAMTIPWDQGPANDLLNVDVRVRERFTYAR